MILQGKSYERNFILDLSVFSTPISTSVSDTIYLNKDIIWF